MPKISSQLSLAAARYAPNSGNRPVPKLDAVQPAEKIPTLLSSLFDPASFTRSRVAGCQSFHGRGSLLFTEGQPALGVFMIEKGCVKLMMCSGRGKSLILGFLGPQSVLGLPAAILGLPHESSAEVMKPVTARFLPREDLLQQMRHAADAGLRAAQVVSQMLYSTLREMETLWLTDSVEQRLARFLISICAPRNGSRDIINVALDLTHEDIAQRLGVSRETVTRILSRLKKRGILDLKQSVLMILNAGALERLADLRSEHREASRDPFREFR
jgi:CRP-like cAMP-binding protein